MGYQRSLDGQLDYSVCHYGHSKLRFRGPRKILGDNYVAFLGGTETFGKFVASPFPDLVGQIMSRQTVNLGCVNAGLDAFLTDGSVRRIAANAAACVIQVTGAHMLTNRYYRVHPRRNDRFLEARPELLSRFPGADFTDVHFARHLIKTLGGLSQDGLELVRHELATLWVWRMRQLIDLVGKPVVLLWVSTRSPDEDGDDPNADNPLFVDRGMLEALRPDVSGIVEIARRSEPGRDRLPPNHLPFADLAAAKELPSQINHFHIAAEVSEVLADAL